MKAIDWLIENFTNFKKFEKIKLSHLLKSVCDIYNAKKNDLKTEELFINHCHTKEQSLQAKEIDLHGTLGIE